MKLLLTVLFITLLSLSFGNVPNKPSQENFTIIGLPDTQFYTANVYGGKPSYFYNQTQWIVDNKDSLNIVFVAHLGDCVNNGNMNEIEWQYADSAMSIIENPLETMEKDGIPYGIAVGNHDHCCASDNNPNSHLGETELYNQYFGENRFLGRAYYGGHYGTKNDQHYELFSASGYDFIAIFLEYNVDPKESVLNWADSLLNIYSTRQAIIVSHYLIRGGNPGTWGSQGEVIFEKLNKHPNLFLMLGGHILGEGIRQDTTINGNIVNTLLSNYQGYPNGGNGFLRIMEFSPVNNEIKVKTYSPILDQFESDNNSQFTIKYNMIQQQEN